MATVRMAITLNARLYGWVKWAAREVGCHSAAQFVSMLVLEAMAKHPHIHLDRPAPKLDEPQEGSGDDAISHGQ